MDYQCSNHRAPKKFMYSTYVLFLFVEINLVLYYIVYYQRYVEHKY